MNRDKRGKAKKDQKQGSPLVLFASILSAMSLVWTTYSVLDLLGTGYVGLTVAIGADLIWAAILYAEYKNLYLGGSQKVTTAVGWVAILAVAGLLVWHGLNADNIPMAVAGPFLPLGAKAVWLLAIAALRDPTELTADQRKELHEFMRESAFEGRMAEADRVDKQRNHEDRMAELRMTHEARMAQESMDAELRLSRDHNDHRINLEREDMRRELIRTSPLTIPGQVLNNTPAITSGREGESDEEDHSSEAGAVAVAGLTDLSEAQRAKKRLVALWVKAKNEDDQLTQAEFCRRMDKRQPYFSKALKQFPPEQVTEEDMMDAQEATG